MSASEITASIFLVGAGRMGGAFLRGWLAAGVPTDRLAVCEPHPSPQIASLLKENNIPGSPKAAPDILVLAVKPQIMTEVLGEVAADAGANTVVLSIAAGRTVASIARHFPPNRPIVRAMPNLPAEIGRGITAAFANPHLSDAKRQSCQNLLSAVGDVAWISDEGQMDAITAVSGSGPGFVFYLAECLAKAGHHAGLPLPLAQKLARATLAGAGELLHTSALSAAQLRENVTSPGGTTAAGLSILMREGGLEDLMQETVAAAAQRSRELSE